MNATGDPLDRSFLPADRSVALRASTIGGVLRAAARTVPDKVALVEGEGKHEGRRRWTFSSLLGEAEAFAHVVGNLFDVGERVALLGGNEPEWLIAMFGLSFAGVVVVPVNPALEPRELEQVLVPSEAVGVIHATEFRGADLAGRLDRVRDHRIRERVVFDEIDQLCRADLVAASPLPAVRPEDLAQVQFTSGTTGSPKGARLHHGGMTNNARLMFERLGVDRHDVWVNPNPLFHLGGCGLGTLGPVQSLATHVLVPRFEPGAMLELLESEGATVTGGVPTMMTAMIDHPDFSKRDLSRLRRISSGGSTVPASLVHRIEDAFGASYSTMFGQTEASPGLTQTFPEDVIEDKAISVGPPLPHVAVKVIDPSTGEVVPCGVVGELLAKSPMVMRGYLNRPEASAAAIDADGWLHTGDLAQMDARGYCAVVGRLKDMIVRGGENIYPRELEDLLFRHPSVDEVAVVGLPDDRWGEIVVGVVQPDGSGPISALELESHLDGEVARHKMPREWYRIDILPRNATGKVLKHVVVEEILAGNLTRLPEGSAIPGG